MSTLPACCAAATMASTACGSVTSTLTAVAFPPAAAIASAVSRAFSPRAAAITCAPLAASMEATARPMPRDAPVTIATRFSKGNALDGPWADVPRPVKGLPSSRGLSGTRLHLQLLDETRAGQPGRHQDGAAHGLGRRAPVSHHCNARDAQQRRAAVFRIVDA